MATGSRRPPQGRCGRPVAAAATVRASHRCPCSGSAAAAAANGCQGGWRGHRLGNHSTHKGCGRRHGQGEGSRGGGKRNATNATSGSGGARGRSRDNGTSRKGVGDGARGGVTTGRIRNKTATSQPASGGEDVPERQPPPTARGRGRHGRIRRCAQTAREAGGVAERR